MDIFFRKSEVVRDPTAEPIDEASEAIVEELLDYERRARALRTEMFDTSAINESTWILLQDLLASRLRMQKMRTKELCATSGLPQTTVLRYLDHLEKFGVITRENDKTDSRVTLVSLSEDGAFWMRKYYDQVITAERMLAKNGKGVFTLSRRGKNDG